MMEAYNVSSLGEPQFVSLDRLLRVETDLG